MTGMVVRKVGAQGSHGTRFVTLPKDWADAMDLSPGTPVQILFEDVAVIIPPGRARSARRVLDALRESGP
jgi:antitoxin component of MazEF toxin-antitoxin module